MLEKIYNINYEELDKIINKKIRENKNKLNKIKIEEIKQENKEQENLIKKIEEYNNIKNSIIMKEMYIQGFKDGINLIIDCKTYN